MPSSPKSKSPKSKSNSPKKSPKSSPGKGNKKADKGDAQVEEEEIVVPVPEGVMRRRMRFLLETHLKSDVEFQVGPKDSFAAIKAHKCMLSAESPIFEKLFAECATWKENKIKETEEEARKLREEHREMEVAAEKAEAAKVAGATKKGSPGKSKGSPGKSKGSPKKSGSPAKSSPKKSPSKSPGKSPKSSPKKSPKSDKGGKKRSPGRSSKQIGRLEGEAASRVNFYKDEVIDEDIIRITDVHPLGFYRLLRYIYFDEIVFTGVVGTLRTLYAARKYGFYDLARSCVNYLEHNVCIEHVLKLLQASFDFNEERLQSLCMRLIANDTFEVVKRPELAFVKKEIIVTLLQQDVLNIKEIELFDAVMHWAENECERIGIPVTAINQRVALGNHNFALIRYPTILAHEFATHIVDSGALRSDELISIMQYYITGRKPNVPYSCRTRRRPCLDLGPLDNASIAFSDRTDVTFLVYSGQMRRANSYRDIKVPKSILPPVDTILIKERPRSGSVPGRFKVDDDDFDTIDQNIRHLARMHDERDHFEYSKKHLAVMRKHYK